MENLYHIFKVDEKCNYIEGTERIIPAKSRRFILGLLSSELSIKINDWDTCIKLQDGSRWLVYYYGKNKQQINK